MRKKIREIHDELTDLPMGWLSILKSRNTRGWTMVEGVWAWAFLDKRAIVHMGWWTRSVRRFDWQCPRPFFFLHKKIPKPIPFAVDWIPIFFRSLSIQFPVFFPWKTWAFSSTLLIRAGYRIRRRKVLGSEQQDKGASPPLWCVLPFPFLPLFLVRVRVYEYK